MKNREIREGLHASSEHSLGAERRDYTLDGKSVIAEMLDLVWYPSYTTDNMHYHNCLEIGMCLSGSGTITLGSGSEPLPFSTGTIVFVPANLRHMQRNAGNPMTRWRYIALDQQRFLREMPPRCQHDVSHHLESIKRRGLIMQDGDACREIGTLISIMYDLKCRYANEVLGELEALAMYILVRAVREPAHLKLDAAIDPFGMRTIEPALLYVSEHYHLEIRIPEMAQACAMSESYFRKVFRHLMGVSPLEYVNRYRIHRAMHLLHVTKSSIQHIANECGFSSAVTFTRNFTRHVGQSPSAWRNMHVKVR